MSLVWPPSASPALLLLLISVGKEIGMRVQQFSLLVGVLAMVTGPGNIPFVAAHTQPPSSFEKFSYPEYDMRARQEEERYLQREQAAQHQVVEQKRRRLRYRLRQQERGAKEAAARHSLPGSQGFSSRTRLAQI